MFMVVGVFQMKDETVKATCLENLKPLLDYTQAKEQGCLSFVLSEAQSDPLTLFVTEAYATEEDFTQVHLQSDETKKWQAVINPLIEAGDVKVVNLIKGPAREDMGFLKR